MNTLFGDSGVELSDSDIQSLRNKLRCKVRYRLGGFCPDVEDIVQESLARLLRAEQVHAIEHPERLGAFLNGICNNVISEYRRSLMRQGMPVEDFPERANPGISHGESLEIRQAVGAA